MSKTKSASRYAAIAVLASACCAAGNSALAQTPEQISIEPRLLQRTLSSRGWDGGLLDQHGLVLEGRAEAGLTYNTRHTPADSNGAGRFFDVKNQDPTLHQIGLALSRPLTGRADEFELGFKLEMIYGADAAFTQANGTNFYGSFYANEQLPLPFNPANPPPNPPILVIVPGETEPENQFDLLQAYVDMQLPVGPGVVLTAGKFVTPWGIEKIDPTKNLFYSHSYIFGVSQPRTLTGVTARVPINERVDITAGIVRGWDQSLEDENDAPSILAQVAFQQSEEVRYVVSGMVGPEQPDDEDDWRWLLNATATLEPRDYPELALAAEMVLGYEEGVGTAIAANGDRLWTGDDAFWFGIAGYLSYEMDRRGAWTLQLRGEYFNDADGARQIISEVYAGTLGLRIIPCPDHEVLQHMIVRPEFRWDYSNDRIFDENSKKAQITLGVDVVFEF